MAEDLEQLEAWAGALLANLSDGERRKLARAVAVDLRRSQHRRMAAQQNPDGSAWPARRKGGQRQRARKPIGFTYFKPGEPPRFIRMASYRPDGDKIIGFDPERGTVRSFLKARMQDVRTEERTAQLRKKRGQLRAKRMMLKLSRKLDVQVSPDMASVGFPGAMTRIARVHHYGLRDQVVRGQSKPSAQYPARRLIGFSEEDRAHLMDLLLAHLEV